MSTLEGGKYPDIGQNRRQISSESWIDANLLNLLMFFKVQKTHLKALGTREAGPHST